MQVSAAQISNSQSSLAMPQRQALANAADPANAAANIAPPPAPETETVSISAGGEHPDQPSPAAGTSIRAPEVFAEIWKDGMKVGAVYTDGHAVLPSIAAGIAAGVHGGSTLPYIHAQELSRMVGGEVRLVDAGALQVAQTRSQLRTAYGN